MDDQNEKSFSLARKIILLVAIVASILAAAISVFNYYGLWEKFRSIETVRSWIESAGPYAVLVYAIIVLLR